MKPCATFEQVGSIAVLVTYQLLDGKDRIHTKGNRHNHRRQNGRARLNVVLDSLLTYGMLPGLPLLFFFLSLLGNSSVEASDLLQYVIRAEPFEIELTLPDGTKQTRQLTRQPDYFFHRVNIRWPVPDGPADKSLRCEIQWVGFPDNFRLINTYDIDRRQQKFETTLGELRKAVFAGGDFRTVISPKGLILVTRGEWRVTDATMLDWADRIAAEHLAVWKDEGLPDHRLYVIATTNIQQGEGRTRGSIMEVNLEEYAAETFQHSLSHEMFHQWNPRRLNTGDNEELYWFTEGFTDYYAVLSLWRAGIWSFQQTVDYFNNVLRIYYSSPMRNLTPTQMVNTRKSDLAAERLPYQQGTLLALHWNRTGKSLDRAMLSLRNNNRNLLSNGHIAKALRVIGLRKASEEIQRFIVEGKTIELRHNLWGACATESRLDVHGFEMGFNSKTSSRTWIIEGVKQDSNAWRAGVRDGQKWHPIDVNFNDPTYLADIEVEDQQGKRRIKFYPATLDVIKVPQFKLTTKRCDPATLKATR